MMMSAPQTNIDKQTKRHRGPLTGILVALGVASALLIGFVAYSSMTGTPDAPQTSSPIEQPLQPGAVPSTPQAETSPSPQIIDESDTFVPGQTQPAD
jgi:hypothetical protein